MQAIDHLHRGQIQTARDTRLIGPAPPLIGTGIINRRAGLRSRAYDVFVHISAVERAGLSHLNEGQKVSFEVKTDPKRGKSSAENLRV